MLHRYSEDNNRSGESDDTEVFGFDWKKLLKNLDIRNLMEIFNLDKSQVKTLDVTTFCEYFRLWLKNLLKSLSLQKRDRNWNLNSMSFIFWYWNFQQQNQNLEFFCKKCVFLFTEIQNIAESLFGFSDYLKIQL